MDVFKCFTVWHVLFVYAFLKCLSFALLLLTFYVLLSDFCTFDVLLIILMPLYYAFIWCISIDIDCFWFCILYFNLSFDLYVCVWFWCFWCSVFAFYLIFWVFIVISFIWFVLFMCIVVFYLYLYIVWSLCLYYYLYFYFYIIILYVSL